MIKLILLKLKWTPESHPTAWLLKMGTFRSILQIFFIIWISLKNIKYEIFRDFSWKFVITIFVKKDFHFELNRPKIETMSASDQNSNMPFLRNEFSKIFEDLLRWRYLERWLIFMIEWENLAVKCLQVRNAN